MAARQISEPSNERIEELLEDAIIIRLVKIIDGASLSILELLEYGITRRGVNHALATGIIVFDKSRMDEYKAVDSDYYFLNFLSSKVKLSKLGLSLLQQIRNHPED